MTHDHISKGTGIIDPPWSYNRASRHVKNSGYSNFEYEPLSEEDLAALPVGELMDYCFLYTTGPFIEQAYRLMRRWDFEPITFMPWIKMDKLIAGNEEAFPKDVRFKPIYGVGYWWRGAVEPIIFGKKKGVKSIRTAWIGLLSNSAEHSRKPSTLYEVIEGGDKSSPPFPKIYTELFGRSARDGWTVLGNEAPGDGRDIRESMRLEIKRRKQNPVEFRIQT